ncbi:MAG TPA: deoxyribonuclease V [Ktedonobacterales bacterium]|nr:deoxyribonuclease V [Ktedonobacterales bacterium]
MDILPDAAKIARDEARRHPWDVSPDEAVAIQKRLRAELAQGEPVTLDQIHTVAGVDASYREIGRAAIAVFSFPNLALIEEVTAMREAPFPYIPGLLAFREGPVALAAYERLTIQPDLLIFDAHGYAHPRRMGLASHLGVYLDRPSIGCAKSRLTGAYEEPGPEPGAWSSLVSRGEEIGRVVRTKARTKPIFVSVGYRITLPLAVEVVLRCVRGYRLPEPTRIADKLTKQGG